MKFANLLPATTVYAHCDLPCGVYDPAQARIEAESVLAITKKYAANDDQVFRMRAFTWPLHLYRVAGESMLPTYQPGDTLLGLRWFSPRAGQVVVAMHQGRPLIKRIAKLDSHGVWLEGDNPGRSTDSRHFGPLAPSRLEARIVARLG